MHSSEVSNHIRCTRSLRVGTYQARGNFAHPGLDFAHVASIERVHVDIANEEAVARQTLNQGDQEQSETQHEVHDGDKWT